MSFTSGAMVKNFPVNEGDSRDSCKIPGSGISPGEVNGNSLQYSCLEIPWTEELGGRQSMESQRVGHERECKHTLYKSDIYRLKTNKHVFLKIVLK